MQIVGYIILGLLLALCLIFFIMYARHLIMFSKQKCSTCGSSMDYKGIRETMDGVVYMFYCPECDKLEEVSEEEVFNHIHRSK